MSYIGGTLSVVSGATSPEDASTYQAKSFTEIGNVISASEIGDTHEDLSAALLKTGRTKHSNGAKDGGEINIMIDGEDFTDAGLAIIEAANGGNTEHSFELAGPTQTWYFYGLVRGLRTMAQDASTKSGIQFTIAVNSATVRVASA